MILFYIPGLAFIHWLAGTTLGALSVLSLKGLEGLRADARRDTRFDDAPDRL